MLYEATGETIAGEVASIDDDLQSPPGGVAGYSAVVDAPPA